MTPMDVLIVVERFFLYWLAYSFAGWVWETGLSVVLRKRFEDRGMLNGADMPDLRVRRSAGRRAAA